MSLQYAYTNLFQESIKHCFIQWQAMLVNARYTVFSDRSYSLERIITICLRANSRKNIQFLLNFSSISMRTRSVCCFLFLGKTESKVQINDQHIKMNGYSPKPEVSRGASFLSARFLEGRTREYKIPAPTNAIVPLHI